MEIFIHCSKLYDKSVFADEQKFDSFVKEFGNLSEKS